MKTYIETKKPSLILNAGIKLLREEPLAKHSTFKIGGPALFFAEPETREELLGLLDFARQEDLAWKVIGRASNILFSDLGFAGLIICLSNFELKNLKSRGEELLVSAGYSFNNLINFTLENGLGGLEFLSGLLATVGGALVMNASFGRKDTVKREIGNLVKDLKVLTQEGEIRTLPRQEIAFSYRKSNLSEYIILEAKLALHKMSKKKIRQEIEENFKYRRLIQDLSYPSAGSIFKNPQGCPQSAGELIDKAGLKGLRIGGAQISEKHANFIINRSEAKASQVLELIEIARRRVKELFGVELELEIEYIE